MMEGFIRIKDMGEVLLDYIGSEDYLKAVESIQDSGKAAFMGGIGMAGCVILARCHKYYGDVAGDIADDEAVPKEKSE